MPMTRAGSRLDLKRQTSVVDEPLDQLVLHGRARRPDSGRYVGRVAQQTDRAFRDHLGCRTIAGIAVALDRCTSLAAIWRNSDEEQVVVATLPFLFRRSLARFGNGRAGKIIVGRHDAL